MSLILALDTSTEQGSIALLDGPSLVLELSIRQGRDLSRILLDAIQHCFRIAGMELTAVDAMAVAAGPGSFTGLRIGVTAAKTLAFALEIPVVPVSSLHALALHALPFAGHTIIAAMDARRGELFAAPFYAGIDGLERLAEDALVSDLQEWAPVAAGPPAPGAVETAGASTEPGQRGVIVVAAGEGGRQAVAQQGIVAEAVMIDYPSARHVAVVGRDALTRGETLDPMQLLPVYIRRSYAEEKAS